MEPGSAILCQMFTGLIQTVGTVVASEARGTARRIRINTHDWGHRPVLGDSISVNGCCLTVAGSPRRGRTGSVLEFDAVAETLGLTTLGRLVPGSRVNLEHACTPTTLMGGHLVQGHVDGVGRVTRVHRGDDWRVCIGTPPGFMQYVAPKGSITVEGVSLTVAGLWESKRPTASGFEVALIPTTLAKTTLGTLKDGDEVNLEADIIAKTVVHWLQVFGDRAPARKKPRTRRSAG